MSSQPITYFMVTNKHVNTLTYVLHYASLIASDKMLSTALKLIRGYCKIVKRSMSWLVAPATYLTS